MASLVVSLLFAISLTKSLELTCKSFAIVSVWGTDLYPVDVCYSFYSQLGILSKKYYCSSQGEPMLATYAGLDCSGQKSSDINVALNSVETVINGCDEDLPPCDYFVKRSYANVDYDIDCDTTTNKFKNYGEHPFVASVCINSFNTATNVISNSRRYDCNPSGGATYTIWEDANCTGTIASSYPIEYPEEFYCDSELVEYGAYSASQCVTYGSTDAPTETTLTSSQVSTENTMNSNGDSGTTDEQNNSSSSTTSSKDDTPDVDSKSNGYMIGMEAIISMMIVIVVLQCVIS